MIKYKHYGNIFIAGVTHNKSISVEFINSIIDSFKFDYYLIELNNSNKDFIIKNNYRFSEFYNLLLDNKGLLNKKAKLIDMPIEDQIKIYDTKNKSIKYNNLSFFDAYLQFHMDKFFYYKIRDILQNDWKQIENKIKLGSPIYLIHNTQMIKREEYMKNKISEYFDSNKRILVVVGLNHFDIIEKHIHSLTN